MLTSLRRYRQLLIANNRVRDPYWASVVLLVDFDGSDASTTFTDLSGSTHVLTAVGDAQLDTAQFKYGTASGLFDGTGDRVTAPDSADWHFGTGAFTGEAHVRFNSLPSSGTIQVICGQIASPGADGWAIGIANVSGVYKLRWVSVNSGATVIENTISITTGVWYHFAIARSSNTIYQFIDGAMLGSGDAFTGDVPDVAAVLEIAASSGGNNQLNGWIDNLRLTKGVARYTANFTPPDRQFPTN